MFRSENIDKGRDMHEAVSKRMKNLIASGPLPTIKTTVGSVKLQMSGRQPRGEKLSTRWSIIDRPSNEKYNFINFSIVNDPIDPKTKIKSCNPQGEQILSPHDIPAKQENESSQVSICSSCSYYNEWIPFDPNYKCYKCKKGL